MVAKVISGKNIRGVLNYNEHKVKEGVARCILAAGFGCATGELSFSDKLNRFEKLTAHNRNTRTNAIHISLNFDVTEKITKEKLGVIAFFYMDKIGFGGQPYLVYEHYDAAHPHIHIVTTNVRAGGKRIDIHNIGRNQSEKARKEIEKRFGLVKAESKKNNERLVNPVDVRKAIYGKSETKRSISNIVRSSVASYKYTSLPELNAVLRQLNVVADRGREGTPMFDKKGLLYSLLDENGHKAGVPIKASSIYGKPTLAYLEKQFKLNEKLRYPFRESLKKAIDRAVAGKQSVTRLAFVQSLNHHSGVSVLFRRNDKGLVYGVTYVDNKNKVVFNGSDLGKSYSAKSILERFKVERLLHTSPKENVGESKFPSPLGEGSGMRVDQTLTDLIRAEPFDQISPSSAMKRRRKKKKRHSL